MYDLEAKLYEFMVERDVPKNVARRAALECSQRMTRNGAIGVVFGFGMGVFTRNPGAVLVGIATGGLVSGGTLINSPSCREVRDAAFHLAGIP